MMQLKLSAVEEKVLAETLESSLSRLVDEIAHTDAYDYREVLKERKAILVKLRERLH